MFGFNYYEDQQFQAQAKASAKAVYDNREWSGTGDQAKETPWYKKSLQEFDYNSNVGYLAASGLKAVEDVGKGAALLGGGLVATVHESGGDHPLAQALFEVADEPTQINVDPEKAHWAFRTVGDIGRTMLPFFIPGIGVATGAITMTATTGIDSLQQGLDVETAQKRALIAGGGATAMAAVAPLSGKALNALFTGEGNAMLEVSKSFALNMGLGQAQRTADWAVVKQKYPEIAKQIEIFGPTTVGLDIAMWAMFAGMGYRQVRQQLVKAGVPVTEASRAIRVAEEIIGADSAVNDAVYVRRQAKTIDDGPLLSPEAYDVQMAMVDDVMARLDNAEPLPVDVPDNVALKPVEQVPVQDTTGRVLLGGREGTRPALPREEVTKFVTDFGLDQNRVVIHDMDNPLPDFILKAAEREGGTATSTEAWLGRDGTLHINLDAFDNVDRLKDVIGFHEITHRGQDVELLAEVQRALPADQFLRSQVERMATERNYDLSTKEGTEKALKEATAEAMMDAVYRGKVADAMNQGWFSSVVNKVKQVLRDLGVKIEYTDEDAARLVGTMWQRGKERLAATPESNQWRTIHEALQDAKYVRRGVSKGKNYTESDFQNHLKEFYPSVYDGAYRKDEVLAAVKNLATNSSRRLTDRQREIISNFEYDLGRVESQMVDVPFSIKKIEPHLDELGKFKTGQPVVFDFVHNTESATKLFGKPKKDSPYDRGYEPSGRYVTQVDDAQNTTIGANMIKGTLRFENPLVVNGDQWKRNLSAAFGNKRGKNLSKAVIAAGYDGIVTVAHGKSGDYISEILDLTTFDESIAMFSIAPKTDTPEFKRWFGNSKVVDENGQPLVVYRGTTGDMPEIDAGMSSNFGEIFFTDSKKLASVYANKYNNGVVVPVYLKIENASDGRILGSGIAIAPNAKIFTVNDIRNVKSAIGNRGTFDPNDARIDFSIAHAAPYMRELDAALAKRGAEGEHTIVDVPEVNKRQIITEMRRNGKVLGYLERWLDRDNTMTRAKVESALTEGNMGVLGEVYDMENNFSRQYGLDLTGVYTNEEVTRPLAAKGGALPIAEGSGILTLKNGREEGKAYNPTPEEMRTMQQARDNEAVRARYEKFLEAKRAEREANIDRIQRILDRQGAAAAEPGAGRGADAGSPAGSDTVRSEGAAPDLTPTQQLDAAMSGLKSLEADDVDFSIALDKDLPDKALQAFGRTFVARAAGYIMPDGQMLDFSGHHYGDPGTRNTRNVDHRELSGSSRYLGWGEFDLTSVGGTEGMFEFMNQSGAVRWMPEANAVSITAPLTRDQAVAIIKAYNETKRYNGQDSLLLGADHPHNYRQIASLDMQRPTVDKILAWSHEVFPVDIRTNAADFSIQPPLPETDGTTGRTAAADSYLKRLVQATENQITVDEAAQIVGTVEKRYDYLNKRTAAQADILTEFKRMGIAEFFKAKPEEYLAMSETERKWALTKAELLATLTGKKEAIRRQKITAETVQREKDTVARMASTSGRNMVESWIDRLMGEPSGKGEVQPWINKAMGIEHEFMAHLAGGIKEFDSWLGVRMSPEQELLLARELHQPGSTGDSAMKKAADHIRTTFDAMRTRANKSGADIGYIEGYYPQAWNSRQVMLFGQNAMTIAKGFKNQAAAIADSKAKWVDFMLQRVDRNHPNYIDEATGTFYTDDQMKAFLGKAFDTISTNGAAKGMAKQGKGSLAARMASERQLHFKDAESWVEANKLFGQNDLLTSVVGEVARRSRDIALLEMFGPNPDRVHQEVLAQAVQTDSASNWFYNRKVNFANALWMEVTGTRGTAGTGMVADAAAAARQGLVFSRLGSALLSQLGDLPIFHAMAVKSGMPEFASMLEMARTLNPAKVGDRAVADTFEFGLSALHDDVMSRVMDTTNGKGLSAKLAKFTMQAGGMQWWADRMAHGAKLLLARGLYQMHGKRFEDQSPGNLALLKRSGITADEWNRQILNNQSIVADFNGREVLAPHLIEDAALREKLWGLIERESTFMALRPDEKTRALIKGSAERGGMEGELRNSMFLFRSFTAAMIQKVYPRLTARLPGETRGQWMYKAGTFMLFSTLMAAMSTQLKEVDKGRNPRDMDDPRFWAQAFGQAWNLGVIGDLLYGERNRFGQTATATIAGPVVGMLEDLGGLTVGNAKEAMQGEETHLGAESIRAVKNYATPNLWYLRPALDQFLWWPLQEMANPGYLQRSQSRIERENGTTFWLPPTGAERY